MPWERKCLVIKMSSTVFPKQKELQNKKKENKNTKTLHKNK